MNIIVEGSRGKSGTVEMMVRAFEALGETVVGKVSGKDTLIFYEREVIPIKRKKQGFLLDLENKPILEQYAHCTHKVFENQALSCYTMRVVHNIISPQIIVIPNIRFEHQDRLGPTLEHQAKSFAENFRGAVSVITTETKPEVLEIFEKYAKMYGVHLNVIEKPEVIPSIQSLYLTNAVVKQITGKEMPKDLYDKFYKRISNNLKIKKSNNHKIEYFYGAKVNDVESTQNVFHYLLDKTEKDFCFLCYFRKDRNERTEAFYTFFDKYLDHPRIRKFYFCGFYVGNHKHEKIERISEETHDNILDYCKEEDLILFTAINGVNDFMKKLERELES